MESSVSKILIIDYNPNIFINFEQTFEEIGCNILKVSSIEEASKLLNENDTVAMMIKSDEVNINNINKLKSVKRILSDIPIFIITGWNKKIESDLKKQIDNNIKFTHILINQAYTLRYTIEPLLELHKIRRTVTDLKLRIKKKNKIINKLKIENKDLKENSLLDTLTQIPNRRNFNKYIKMQWKSCLRDKLPISLIMIDIDYFKQFNDNYGHCKGGDRCLTSVAQRLRASVSKPMDLVSRYGGEEFVAVLPYTDSKGAFVVAERMRKNIEKLKISHDYSQVKPFVSISLGVATIIPKSSSNLEDFIHNADMALYKAKEQGRDRVIKFEDIEEVSMKY